MTDDETREEAVEPRCGCDPQVRLERALTTITNLGQIADDSLDDARRIATEALRGASVPEESVALRAEVERLRGALENIISVLYPICSCPEGDSCEGLKAEASEAIGYARSALAPKVTE